MAGSSLKQQDRGRRHEPGVRTQDRLREYVSEAVSWNVFEGMQIIKGDVMLRDKYDAIIFGIIVGLLIFVVLSFIML